MRDARPRLQPPQIPIDNCSGGRKRTAGRWLLALARIPPNGTLPKAHPAWDGHSYRVECAPWRSEGCRRTIAWSPQTIRAPDRRWPNHQVGVGRLLRPRNLAQSGRLICKPGDAIAGLKGARAKKLVCPRNSTHATHCLLSKLIAVAVSPMHRRRAGLPFWLWQTLGRFPKTPSA